MNLDKLPRDVAQAMWRGFRGRCPACGEGRLFRAFLKVNESCSECGEDHVWTKENSRPVEVPTEGRSTPR